MRKTQLTTNEILEAEKASELRTQKRNRSFSVMKNERDIGSVVLSNKIRMLWSVPKPEGGDYIWEYIPEDSFVLVLNGKKTLFNTEEFRKWLRWA